MISMVKTLMISLVILKNIVKNFNNKTRKSCIACSSFGHYVILSHLRIHMTCHRAYYVKKCHHPHNCKYIIQEAFEKSIRHCEPPHDTCFTLPFTRCHYCRTPPLSHAACASMSTTTTTTTRDRGDHYGPIEWVQ